MIRTVVISFLLLSILPVANAQNVAVKIDTLTTEFKPDFRPASIRFGTDVLSLINTEFKEGFSGWEITADTEIHRYLFVVDFGHSEEKSTFTSTVKEETSTTFYRNNGNYWRAGIDVNFLTRDPDKNAFFIGLHYARSSYDEFMTVDRLDTLFGRFYREYANNGMSAGWLEVNTGLKVKIWKQLWLGYTARLKFGLSDDDSGAMLAHNVPGYGVVDKETAWGFNYYIFYRIPFRPTKAILPPKKK